MKSKFQSKITTGRVLIFLYALVCIVTGYNIIPIRKLTSESIARYGSITESATNKLEIISRIRLNLENIESAKFKHIVKVKKESMLSEIKEMESAVSSNDSLFAVLMASLKNPGEELILNDVLAKRKLNQESRKNLIALSMEGKKNEAIRYYETVNEKAWDDYNNSLTQLTSFIVKQTQILSEQTGNYIHQKHRTVDAVLLLSVIMVLITGIVVFIVNRKLNLQYRELAAQEKKYYAMVENTDEMMATINKKGEIIWANRAWKENTLYTDEDIQRGIKAIDLADESSKKWLTGRMENAFRGDVNKKDIAILVSKGGNKIYLEGKSIPLMKDGKIAGIQTFSRNITNRIMMEELLEEKEKNYRLVVESMHDGICIDDAEGKVIFANRQFCRMHGVDEGRIPGLMLEEYIAPDYQAQLRDIHNKRFAGEKVPEEFTYEAVDVNGRRRIYEVRVTPIIEHGKITGTQSINRDITESKAAEEELKRNYSDLKKVNEELDRFVYSTSHDLRAPLLAVEGLLNLMEGTESKTDMKQYQDTMRKIIGQMDNTIKEILDYSRNARTNIIPEQLEMDKIIKNAGSQILQSGSSAKINFSVDVEETVPFYSDKIRITTLVNNLLVNAFKYTREGETNPFIKVKFVSGEKEGVLTVEDNGEGIAPDNLEKIFEMFFRISEQSEGSGLGLYICREITERLNGSIAVTSVLGKGSIFTVRIPNMNYIKE